LPEEDPRDKNNVFISSTGGSTQPILLL
jgi:hypothetical protein